MHLKRAYKLHSEFAYKVMLIFVTFKEIKLNLPGLARQLAF